MALTAPERETVITSSDGDDYVEFWTTQRKVITRLRRNERVEIVDEGTYEGSEWVHARILASLWSPTSGVKRKSKPMTEEQRQAAGERLRKAREA